MAKKIKSSDLLPDFLQTDKNKKFLSGTIDQLIQIPALERLDGFIGSKLSPNYDAKNDNYISDNSFLRTNYQLSPSLIINDKENNVTDVISFDDLVNEIKLQGGKTDNFDRLFETRYYAYQPLIDWDKFINYQEYYWLTTGPQTIVITGQPQNTTSTYVVKENVTETGFVFSYDGEEENPLITLYRGNTYIFDIDTTNNFYIKTLPTLDSNNLLPNITNNGTKKGQIILTVTTSTPSELYYVGLGKNNIQGQFVIKTVENDTTINVEDEIVGKKNYQTNTGIELSNGMKIQFGENVMPESYRNKEYFVEGVGQSIRLIDYDKLSLSSIIADVYDENFDISPFDQFPFDSLKNLPINPEYITINRGSKDLNPWSRYNRWVHSSVIKASAEANGQLPVYPIDKRAKRPIIEFLADIQLFNYGNHGIDNVDLIDTITGDAFSEVVGTAGYYVDQVLLEQGHRVIFNADRDPNVRGKIYEVNYKFINGKKYLELKQTNDHSPNNMASVGINLGVTYGGSNWWYNGTDWMFAQQHIKLNESPLFDLFDNDGLSYSKDLKTDFQGNKIFGYTPGTINDPVLGFPIKQENSVGIGSYSFKNYLMTESFNLIENSLSFQTINTNETFVKINKNQPQYRNAWIEGVEYNIPIIQVVSITAPTDQIKIDAVDFSNSTYANFDIFVNSKKLNSSNYTTTVTNKIYTIQLNQELTSENNVYIKITSDGKLIETKGYYELPISLVNNPDNGIINELTLSEIENHVRRISEVSSEFSGVYPGNSNLRNITNVNGYANQIVSNINPGLFAEFFIGKKEHNVLDAISICAYDYNQFKLSFINQLSKVSGQTDPISILDSVLLSLNQSKTATSPYYYSDMLGYGTDKIIKKWTVSNTNIKIYPLTENFDLNNLSLKSILVYKNDQQLLVDKDYKFVEDSVEILASLSINDVITLVTYFSTEGAFVPPTPTKLGLYPKFEPKIYFDDSYIEGATKVIQGHDGSITIAFDDYRDDVILEFEKRVYNNIKVAYRHDLLDYNSVIPGAFRQTEYSTTDINDIIEKEFINWAGLYGVEYSKNTAFDIDNSWTWNYKNSWNPVLGIDLSGYWRSIYKYFYDTDRPHSHPWEMLGFSEKPNWWDDEYGPAPYTSGNDILWNDVELGNIRQGARKGIDKNYARPLLSQLLPVDEYGQLVEPTVNLATNITSFNQRQSFVFGDSGPAETTWRKSSYWPFVIQKLLALTKPALFASLMYDVANLEKNIAGQWTYGENRKFLSLKNAIVPIDKSTLTAGYSVFVVEAGRQKLVNYVDKLLSDIQNYSINLFHKVGGFVSKNKLQIIIDAFDPVSTAPGAILPQEDYRLILNTSNPTKSYGISGIIVQKLNGKFVVRGYDTSNPYFTIYPPIRNQNTPAITVGGVSAPYVEWSNSVTGGNTGLNDADLATANSSATARYYQQGQIVLYQNKYYVTKVSHYAKSTFNAANFQQIPSLPIKGGATVQIENGFSKIEQKIPYGTEFSKVQEVYDFIIGYGAWLEGQGFIFDQYNSELNEVLNWKFTGKEFLYWTTQNWANNNLIALSPFADQIKFKSTNAVVDNLFSTNYKYEILQVNGVGLPQTNLSVNREDGLCTINTVNTVQGMYFVRLHLVQKEHGLVFNNTTIFNDTIYDAETGYKQQRIKLVGFRTKNWDGDYFSPGFVYDNVEVSNWEKFKKYKYGDVVKYAGKYYTATKSQVSSETFDFADWVILNSKPQADLLPNFDYKIKQFDDFYSLDIDNFDSAQQQLAQHLVGYTPRVYLNNIFTDPITQYKFYQGFIKEKGTKNAISKLAKASIQNLQGEITYNEIWAFRLGHFGSFETFKEVEMSLVEGSFYDNPQIINFVDTKPNNANDLIYYQTPENLLIKPKGYVSSQTFVTLNSTFEDNNFQIKTAGYVRLDDVTATAYNDNSLFDIANNGLITQGNTIWIGFRSDGEWDVLQYNKVLARIIAAESNVNGTEVVLTTDQYHGIKVNEIISITKFNEAINGVYRVVAVPALNKFTISLEIDINISIESLDTFGIIFKFESHRFDTYNNLYEDSKILELSYGTKFWIDTDINGKWVVYEKIRNYKLSDKAQTSGDPDTNQFGYSIFKQKNDNTVLIGAPNYYDGSNYGRLDVYKEQSNQLQQISRLSLNENANYHTPGTKNEFGYSSFYDPLKHITTDFGLIFVGAPGTSNVISNSSGTVRVSTGTGIASSYVQEGAVKITRLDPTLLKEINADTVVLLSPAPSNYQRFGASIYVQQTTSTKLTLIGAPGTLTTGSGAVYAYRINAFDPSSLVITSATTGIQLVPNGSMPTGSQWGYAISGSDDASVIAISAPGVNVQKGSVQIFSGTTYVQTLSIPSDVLSKSRFGEKVLVTPDGSDVFVSAPYSQNVDRSKGKVFHYRKNTQSGLFTLTQVISNPVPEDGMIFGASLDINYEKNILIVSALGTNNRIQTTFDTFSEPSTVPLINDPESEDKLFKTFYDSKSTVFNDGVKKTGTVYLYDNKHSKFVLADEVIPPAYYEGNNYGHAIAISEDKVYVGAPSYSTTTNVSYVYYFDKINTSISGFNVLRSQNDVVDISAFNRSVLIDTDKEEIIEYLDIIDPVKGKIAGIAQEEISYRSEVDPAVYSIGNSSTINDSSCNWLDEHVGELWWDLSSVKYFYYEQGELTFRKNSWGKLFPGATIDVYEWVRSEYLPNEWAGLADTAEGLINNISGQPKYPDNSVVSVKQILDPVTGTFFNVYYFWVKNKVTIPNVKNRRISSYQVANIIADPVSYGLKTVQIISPDALTVANVGTQLVDNKVSLNVTFDSISNNIPRHTEWLLIKENSETDGPTSLLEKKLIDSILGRDSIGNLVPDPTLSFREKYGISVRPRQSMFKDRFEAFRNIVEFVNEIFTQYPITDKCSFVNLNKEETIPDVSLNEYDVIVEDIDYLNLEVPDPIVLQTAELRALVKNGKIYEVIIDNPGFGYRYPPTVKIFNDENNSTVEIKTEIDIDGKVIKVNVVNGGTNFSTAPQLIVRPFTAIVLIDENLNNRWGKYNYNHQLKQWVKVATQKFNTKLYWNYVDWQSDNYKPYVDYAYTLDNVYELKTISNILPGEYIKIKNGGSGRFIILEKTENDQIGTFGIGYSLVYSENGTIQISDETWKYNKTNLTFDNNSNYDQTLYDQTPDIEIINILTALKNDIFIDDLKINWNKLFFKAVRYALSEQKLLDWAFKTSFIDVVNYAGELSQKSVYKLENNSYYEDYLKEVKPYHSVIRNFTTNYTNLEPTNSYVTDFDKPTYYNSTLSQFIVPGINDGILDQYPWKSWKENYKYIVSEIIIADPGSGYESAPTVTITAVSGDTGTGATAKAYISAGEIYKIEITNPGKDYTRPPIVTLSGGGVSPTHARAYARLTNNKVRANKIGLTFDRITKSIVTSTNFVVDNFICDGYTNEFILTWVAQPDRLKTSVTLNGNIVLGSDYNITYYNELYNGYNKKFSKIVFLNSPPANESVLKVEYQKSSEILNAVEKIVEFYTETTATIGKDLIQLIKGIEYPFNQVIGLPFDYTSKWDVEFQPFGKFAYADIVESSGVYEVATIASPGSPVINFTNTSQLSVGQYANIISTTTNKFYSSDEIKIVAITGTTVLFNSTLSDFVYPGDLVEIWSQSISPTLIDTNLEGGSWITTNSQISNALGINPEDVVVTGDIFFSENSINSTEELVPGFVTDTLGINVYTKSMSSGAPLVYSGYTSARAGQLTYVKLPIVPPGSDYIRVMWNNEILEYNPDVRDPVVDWTNNKQFTIDWTTNTLIVVEQPADGIITYTIVGIGTSEGSVGVGLIDNQTVTVTDQYRVQVKSLSSFESVGSAYVTVNGVPLNKVTTSTEYGYMLVEGTNSDRAAVEVYFFSFFNVNTVQAIFFSDEFKYFNEIKTQTFNVGGSPQTTFTLAYPPGILQPLSANIIVNREDNSGSKRLLPPFITYYDITNSINSIFAINKYSTDPTKYNLSSFNVTNVKVYVNGQPLRPGFDYTVPAGSGNINLNSFFVKAGNVVAIECLVQGLTADVQFDYTVIGNQLLLQTPVSNVTLYVTTFNDHDSLLLRTERFVGSPNRRYKISRPVLTDNFVWVQVNGIPLTNKLDYELLSDGVTVQISDAHVHTTDDEIVIMSIGGDEYAVTVLGYRIFNDIFNRTHFKRLSKNNTTYLTKELAFTDTEIHVADSGVLTSPIPSKNIPGVILVDCERIEFFQIDGNVLKQLRRSTLGTAPSTLCEIGTKVIDQGVNQTIPYTERTSIQSMITTDTSSYVISVLDSIGPVRIDLFGDSLMCGRDPTKAPPPGGVCRNGDLITGRTENPPQEILYNYLTSLGYNVDITTRSAGGSSATNLILGTDNVNGPWPTDVDANIVVFNYAFNDVRLGATSSSYRNSLITLREKVVPGQLVLWVAPVPIAVSPLNGQYQEFGLIMKEIASQYGDVIADPGVIGTSTWLTYITVDGLHPNQAGYDAMVNQAIGPAMETVISRLYNRRGAGITLSSNVSAVDQIQVIYGGRPLSKTGVYYHDISVAFDSPTYNIKGSTSTTLFLPLNAIKNDAYLITENNQVWVYTNSKKSDSINGFEYNGLNYIPPEFSVNTQTQTLNLNIYEGVQSNVELRIVKKDFRRDSSWNNEITTSTTLSLLDSTTLQAEFIRQQPAELPGKYYYGGT